MRKLAFILFLGLQLGAKCQTPTVAASNIKFTFIGCNEFTMTWTNGNGSDRVVFVREASALSDVPEYNEYYTDNAIFGMGEDIKSNKTDFCVYKGPGSSITVKGLKNITKYYVGVFEYNGGSGKYDYLTSSFATDNVTTKNIVANFIKDTARCLNGNVINFTNKSTSDLTPLSFVWKFADNDSSKLKDPTKSYAMPGIKPVLLIAKAPGCYTTKTINDTIRPHPVAKFSLDPALKPKNDTVQCFFGNRFTFKNGTTLLDISDGPSSMRYEWFDDGNYFASGYKADKAFSSAGYKTVKLVVISNRGCKDSTTRVYKVLPRAIDPSLVVFSSKSMCLSNAVFKFTNNSPNSIAPHKWYFREESSPKDDDSSIGQSVSYTFNKLGKKYVYLRVYDAGGCLDQLKDSIDVFKNTNVSFSGLKTEYCLNDAPSILKPTPGNGEFIGNNVSAIDSSFTPASIGVFKVSYVSSKGSCRDTFSQSTTVLNKPNVYLGKDTSICKDSPLQLNVNPSYAAYWSTGSSASFINIVTSGNYWVIVKEGICSDTDNIDIKSLGTPTLKHSRDTTLCGGSYLKFSLKVDDGSIIWNDGSTLRDRNISQSGFYKVIVNNKCGSVSDSFNLNVEETACIVFFPNAFTPNGDVLNDIWQPFGKYEFIRMNIYNRWGERVYFSDKSPQWNGYDHKNLCLDGVYLCIFEYLAQEGNTLKRETKGIPIHLVR